MIILKITNASEVVAENIGKFLESLTPDSYDQAKVEDIVMQKLIESLQAEGVKGDVAAVKGLDLEGGELVLRDNLKVRRKKTF